MHPLRFPGVRLGGTSWVVPGAFSENMRVLSKEAQDMQLVLFDNQYGSNIPTQTEVRELAALRRDLDMSCTVHFPDDICLSTDAAERVRCEDSCLRIMELFAPLEPFAWILHLDGELFGRFPSADMPAWLEKSGGSLKRLADNIDEPAAICVETLDYNIEIACPLIEERGLSMCLDIGHLVRYGHPVLEQMRRYLPHTRCLHIHGVTEDGTDHVSMSSFDPALFRAIVSMLAQDGRERVMTLEVFENNYELSLEAIRKFISMEEKGGY
ncbi:MAG: cobamide remodeling phosphodiesterase CbiR [Cloacibacillus sp.]